MTYVEITTYLAGAALGLTAGTNLFAGPLPAAEAGGAAQVGLVGYFGTRPSEPGFGSADLKHEWPRLQVQVRGPQDDLQAADTLAHNVYKALGRVQAMTLTGTFYKQITCLQPPFFLKYDDNRRPIVAFNIEAEKDVSA